MLISIARLAVPKLADWCAVDMLEPDGSLRRLAVEHIDPAKVELAHQLADATTVDIERASGVPNVLRRKQPELTLRLPRKCSLPQPATQNCWTLYAAGYQFRDDNSALLPVTVRWEQFHSSQQNPEAFQQCRCGPGMELARHAGLSIENALLFHETQRQNAQLEARVMSVLPNLRSLSMSLRHF